MRIAHYVLLHSANISIPAPKIYYSREVIVVPKIAFAKNSRHDEEPMLRSIEKFLGVRFLDVRVTSTNMWVCTESSQLARLVRDHRDMLRSK